MSAPQVITLNSPKATRRLGQALGRLLRAGDFVALVGTLGAGKTLLVRAAAEGAGVPDEEHASSPTFAIVHVYRGGRVPLQHMDLYRLKGPQELFALGFDDLLAEPAATLCEWPERAGAMLPAERLEIALEITGKNARQARVSAFGARAEELKGRLEHEAIR